MYCIKCGNFLTGNEKFCSNCGAQVEEKIVKTEKAKKETLGNDLVWNTNEFPDNRPKKTGDIDFDWGADDLYRHSRYKKEEVTFFGMNEGKEKEKPVIDTTGISFESLAGVFSNTKTRREAAAAAAAAEELKRPKVDPIIVQPATSVIVDTEEKPREDFLEAFTRSAQEEEAREEELKEREALKLRDEQRIAEELRQEIEDLERKTGVYVPVIHEPNMTPPPIEPEVEAAADLDPEPVVLEEGTADNGEGEPKRYNTVVFNKETVKAPPITEEPKIGVKSEPKIERVIPSRSQEDDLEEKKSFFSNLISKLRKKPEEEEPEVKEEAIDYSHVSAEDFKNPQFPDGANLNMRIKPEGNSEESFDELLATVREKTEGVKGDSAEDEELICEIDEDTKKIDKFYTFSKKNEEFQDLLDKEYERIERKIEEDGLESDVSEFMEVHTGPMMEATSQIEEMAKSRELFFDGDDFFGEGGDVVPKRAQRHKSFFGKSEGPREQREASDSSEEGPTGSVDSPVVVEEIEPMKPIEPIVVDTLLKDNELEAELQISPSNDTVASAKIESTKLEPLSPAQEELTIEDEEFFDDEEPTDEEPTEYEVASYIIEPAEGEELEITEPNTDEIKMENQNLQGDEGSTKAEEEQGTEEEAPPKAHVIIDPAVIHAEIKEEAKAKEAREAAKVRPEASTGVKTVVGVIAVFIIIMIALLLIRITMPNAAVSRYMDVAANKVFALVNGEKVEPDEGDREIRSTLIEDKSGLIKLQIDNNYKDNIKTIKYNSKAKYDENKKYKFEELSAAKDIQKNEWFKDNKGKVHYFDEEIVGTIIAFESERTEYLKNKDKKVFDQIKVKSPMSKEIKKIKAKGKKETFDILEIGDIKVAGNNYYVWTIEDRNGKRIKKIYKMEASEQKILLVASSNA